ncbi:MAG TPA: hypothetical protein VE825_01230 [Terriglobales bacterium]|jgi:hypothetical protein|nr:hypothetical protein [Terriglobales bacterium]
MADKKVRITLTKSGKVSYSPDPVHISIDAQDDVIWESAMRFRITAIKRRGKKRGGRTGPFFRPFPRRGDPFRKKVNSGPAREGTRGSYKVSLAFHNGKKDDPIIIIDQ